MRESGSAGFTLVEVLIGVVIVGLAATATALTMQSAANFLGENTTHVEAVGLAQAAIEELRTLRYDAIETGQRASEDGRYSVAWHVDPDSPETGMKAVTVEASWTWKGEPRSYVLKTVYSRISAD